MRENPPSQSVPAQVPSGVLDSDQILHFRSIWSEAMDEFEERIPDLPDISNAPAETAGAKLRAYVETLQETIAISKDDPRSNIFDRCLGVQRWHIGKALLLLKPLETGKRGLIGHGNWDAFLDAVGLDDTMAWRCRAVADFFPTRQDAARVHWQWQTMVDSLPSRKKKQSANDGDDDAAGNDASAEGDDDTETGGVGDPVATDVITPIGNHVTRLSKKADDLLASTISAREIIVSGKSEGLFFSASSEAASFKSFVPEIEAVVGSIYESVLNLYHLAGMASESELVDIKDDLKAFLDRHRNWRGQVRENDQ